MSPSENKKWIPVAKPGEGLKTQLQAVMGRALGHMSLAAKRDEAMVMHLYNAMRLLCATVDELVNALPDDEKDVGS